MTLAQEASVLDAIRNSDGESVTLKRINRNIHPFEVEIATMLSAEPLRSHPSNHCVPILEVLDVPNQEGLQIIVMPLLRAFNDPAFVTVGESVEFFRQLFEVRDMHSQTGRWY